MRGLSLETAAAAAQMAAPAAAPAAMPRPSPRTVRAAKAAARPTERGPGQRQGMVRRLGMWLFVLLMAGSLFLGWQIRQEGHLTAESDLGYALGIVGGVMMLLLLGYPLRKRFRFLRGLAGIEHWFRIHMLLGVLGPVLIVFHSNFDFGSMNSSVALISMLVVAGSGLVGRYIYTRIHHGLYGRRIDLAELREAIHDDNERMAALFELAPKLRDRLSGLEAAVTAPTSGMIGSTLRVLSMGLRSRWTGLSARRNLRRALAAEARRQGWPAAERRRYLRMARAEISDYLAAVRRVAGFAVFERLFSLWHMLHLPLFFILLISSIVHVFAVHLY